MKLYLGVILCIALMVIGIRDSERSKTPDLAPPVTVTEPIVITVAPEPETPQPTIFDPIQKPAQPVERDTPKPSTKLVDPSEKTTLRKVERLAVAAPRDGQFSPRGEWRWSEKAWAWQPVKAAGPQYSRTPRGNVAYVEPNTRAAYLLHLSQEHGFDRSWLETQDAQQLFALHSDAHYGLVDSSRVKWAGNCPNGQCARPSNVRTYSKPRGLFRRR